MTAMAGAIDVSRCLSVTDRGVASERTTERQQLHVVAGAAGLDEGDQRAPAPAPDQDAVRSLDGGQSRPGSHRHQEGESMTS